MIINEHFRRDNVSLCKYPVFTVSLVNFGIHQWILPKSNDYSRALILIFLFPHYSLLYHLMTSIKKICSLLIYLAYTIIYLYQYGFMTMYIFYSSGNCAIPQVFICSVCPLETVSLSSYVFFIRLHLLLFQHLLSHIMRCSRLILYIFCLSSRIIPGRPVSLYWRTVFKI